MVTGLPPATTPAPMMILENATWNWTVKNPPDDSPEIERLFLSTL